MDTQVFAPKVPDSAEWLAFQPEIAAVLIGAAFMVWGAFGSSKKWAPYLGIFCFALLTAFSAWFNGYCPRAFGQEYDSFLGGMFGYPTLCWIFPLCGFLSASMAVRYFRKLKEANAGEFLGIMFVACSALSLIVRADNLMATFASLETSAICFYALIAWGRRCAANLEGSIRYLILSGVSGAFLLLGIAFVYGASFECGVDLLYFKNFEYGDSALFYIGMALAASALFFKLGAFPFQFWVPDVYAAAPAPVSAFLASASKCAAFFALFKLLGYMEYSEKIALALGVCAAAGIVIGSLGGLGEKNAKRIVGFSGIVNAGYIMVFLASFYSIFSREAVSRDAVVLMFLTMSLFAISYVLSVYGVLMVQNFYAGADDSRVEISDYNSLKLERPSSTAALAIALGSLAGVPPTAGFFAKLFVLVAAYMAGIYWLMFVLIAGSAASVYYYFKWMREAYTPASGGAKIKFEAEGMANALLMAVSLASLMAGVYFFSKMI
ncbi:MAG: NADH-quinone oxidoreductase subunit N [Opitutales bacterium]|nr:NADH-quinone oxidoreductase subunit N [Opitutales bacterium]